MESAILIRLFRPEDADATSALIAYTLKTSNGPHYPDEVIKEVTAQYSPGNLLEMAQRHAIIVAESDGAVVGVAAIEKSQVLCVYVHPDQQGRGVGKQLMEKIESIARSRRIRQLVLNASTNSVDFYARLGYKQVREIYRKGRLHQVVMTRKLH